MFGKADKDPAAEAPMTTPGGAINRPTPAPARESGKPSLVSADLKVIGNLHSNGDLQVDGKVEGDINSRTLTIGDSAKIEGSVFAESIRVCGSVNGQVKAEKVTIAKSARVTGDIVYKVLSVEEGAFVEGHCRRFETEKGDAKVSTIKPAPTNAASGGSPVSGGTSAPASAAAGANPAAGGKPVAR